MIGDDDEFNQATKTMFKNLIIVYIVLACVVLLGIVGLLYLIKVWFFGGF